jgi:WD40 repeat protein
MLSKLHSPLTDRAQTAIGRLLGTEAQRRLAQPITQETSPLIAALATTGWRLGKASDAWNAMQRVPLVTTLARITHDGVVLAVVFSPDGQFLATASLDKTARITAVADGRELARVTHDGEVTAVAFSPDGQFLATASWDKTVRITAVADGRERVRIVHDNGVLAVVFSPDGQFLATASQDNTVRFWSTTLDDMLHQLCTSRGRNLSPGEWYQYLGDLPWQPTCESWPTPED